MRIALCDDDRDLCQRLARLISTCAWGEDPPVVSQFFTGEQLWFAYGERPQPFDLIILDIEMPKVGGLEVAGRIRSLGDGVPIIFLTCHEKYAIPGYEVLPYRYLLKPVESQRLLLLVEELSRQRLKRWNEYLNIKLAGEFLHIPYSQVLYGESRNQNIFVHTVHQTHRMYRKLSQLRPLLDERFCQVHKSYVINLDYLDQVSKHFKELRLRLVDRPIPISQTYRKLFLRQLSDYTMRHGLA